MSRVFLWSVVFSFVLSAFCVTSRGLPHAANQARRDSASTMATGGVAGRASKRAGGGAPEFMAAPAMAGAAAPMMAAADAAMPMSMPMAESGMAFGKAAYADGGGAPFRTKGSMGSVVNDMMSGGGELPPAKDVLQGPVILRDGSMSAEVFDIPSALAGLERDMKALGAYVSSSNTWVDGYLVQSWAEYKKRVKEGAVVVEEGVSSSGQPLSGPPEGAPTSASVQLRVPADRFDDALAAVKALAAAAGGRVTSHSTNAQDATDEYVDVVTRQRIEEKALAQMETLLKAAESVDHVLSIKREMDAISYRLESAKARRKSLEGRASMSSLSISFNVPRPPFLGGPPPPPPAGWSVGGVFSSALGALGGVLQGLLEVLIYTLVFAGPVMLVAVLVTKVLAAAPVQHWGATVHRKLLAVSGGATAAANGGASSSVGPMGSI